MLGGLKKREEKKAEDCCSPHFDLFHIHVNTSQHFCSYLSLNRYKYLGFKCVEQLREAICHGLWLHSY